MRHDPDLLARARARARLASGEAYAGSAGVPARILARQGRGLPAATVAAIDVPLLMAVADPDRLARVILRAAAIGHAGTMARAIGATERRRVAEIVDAETRTFALRHRSLAEVPEVPLADLPGALAATAARIRGALRAALPAAAAPLVPEPVAPPEGPDADRLAAALAAEERP